MGLGCGKLYVTIERRPCFFRRKNSQSAIFTARHKNSHCEHLYLSRDHCEIFAPAIVTKILLQVVMCNAYSTACHFNFTCSVNLVMDVHRYLQRQISLVCLCVYHECYFPSTRTNNCICLALFSVHVILMCNYVHQLC